MHMTQWHYAVRMAPTVSSPSQTTGIPEITPSPRFSPSSILQGKQTAKTTFVYIPLCLSM